MNENDEAYINSMNNDKNIILEKYITPDKKLEDIKAGFGTRFWFTKKRAFNSIENTKREDNVKFDNAALRNQCLDILFNNFFTKKIDEVRKAFSSMNCRSSIKFPDIFSFEKVFGQDYIDKLFNNNLNQQSDGDYLKKFDFTTKIDGISDDDLDSLFAKENGFCMHQVIVTKLIENGIVDETYINSGNISNDEKYNIENNKGYVIFPLKNTTDIFARIVVYFNSLNFITSENSQINEYNPNYVKSINGNIYISFGSNETELKALAYDDLILVGKIEYYPDRTSDQEPPKNWADQTKQNGNGNIVKTVDNFLKRTSTAAGAADLIKDALGNFFSKKADDVKGVQEEKINVTFDLSNYGLRKPNKERKEDKNTENLKLSGFINEFKNKLTGEENNISDAFKNIGLKYCGYEIETVGHNNFVYLAFSTFKYDNSKSGEPILMKYENQGSKYISKGGETLENNSLTIAYDSEKDNTGKYSSLYRTKNFLLGYKFYTIVKESIDYDVHDSIILEHYMKNILSEATQLSCTISNITDIPTTMSDIAEITKKCNSYNTPYQETIKEVVDADSSICRWIKTGDKKITINDIDKFINDVIINDIKSKSANDSKLFGAYPVSYTLENQNKNPNQNPNPSPNNDKEKVYNDCKDILKNIIDNAGTANKLRVHTDYTKFKDDIEKLNNYCVNEKLDQNNEADLNKFDGLIRKFYKSYSTIDSQDEAKTFLAKKEDEKKYNDLITEIETLFNTLNK